jgi:hypothetical protein
MDGLRKNSGSEMESHIQEIAAPAERTAGAWPGLKQSPSRARRGPAQQEFDFVSDLEATVAGSAIPRRVLDEIAALAYRRWPRADDAIADVLWRECGGSLGANARRAVATAFLAEEDRRHRTFCVGLGLACHDGSPERYGPGSWTLSQEWPASVPVFVIDGVRNRTGEFVAVRLDSKAFHRASSVLRSVICAVGSDDYVRPPAAMWRRIWNGGRRGEAGVMTELLVGLRPSGEQDLSIDRKEKAP